MAIKYVSPGNFAFIFQMGDYLVVGVHTDAEIEKHKGPPVFTQVNVDMSLGVMKLKHFSKILELSK